MDPNVTIPMSLPSSDGKALTSAIGTTNSRTVGATIVLMTKTITFRPDQEALRAIALLTQNGTPISVAVRDALVEAARLRARQDLLEEASRLAADGEDRAEAAQVLREMKALRAW